MTDTTPEASLRLKMREVMCSSQDFWHAVLPRLRQREPQMMAEVDAALDRGCRVRCIVESDRVLFELVDDDAHTCCPFYTAIADGGAPRLDA